jgi:hypothetical protein
MKLEGGSYGLYADGTSGYGAYLDGGGTSHAGLYVIATSSASSSPAAKFVGDFSGEGLLITPGSSCTTAAVYMNAGSSSSATGLHAQGGSSGGAGIKAFGYSYGLHADGTTGHGAYLDGGGSSSSGLYVTASNISASTPAMAIVGSNTGEGVKVTPGSSCSTAAMLIDSSSTSSADGIEALSGSSGGSGLKASGYTYGIQATASAGTGFFTQGTSYGLYAHGSTGTGAYFDGDSGHGIDAAGSSYGMNIVGSTYGLYANGTSGSGMYVLGSSGSGLKASGSTYDFEGNIQGALSGAVGSVTGAVGSVAGNVDGSVGSVTGAINTAAGTLQTLDGLDTAQDTKHDTTAGKVDIAQADLDIITGSDGVTFAATQPNYAPIEPTTAGRKLDVTAAGNAGIDWGNVENPTTTVALTGTTVAPLYHADIHMTIDEANSRDEYVTVWFKDGVRQTSGITVPTIQVVENGSDLIASITPNAGDVGNGVLIHRESTVSERTTGGEPVTVIVTATIDSSTRTFVANLSRDDT